MHKRISLGVFGGSERPLRTALLGRIQLLLVGFFGLFVIPACTQPYTDSPLRAAVRGEKVEVAIDAREAPMRIAGMKGMQDLVSDDELLIVLASALPMWNPPTIPVVLHELRLWGLEASFPVGMIGKSKSGESLRDILLNNAIAKTETVGEDDYLVSTPYGIKVLQNGTDDSSGMRGQGHYGQLLKVLGEAGVPLSTAVVPSTGNPGTVRDLLNEAVMQYTVTSEQEWIAIGLISYLKPGVKSWKDKFGEVHQFDDLAHRLMSAPIERGTCFGCHIPYALVNLLRADEVSPLFSSGTRDELHQWFSELCGVLERSKLPDGGWDTSWAGPSPVPKVIGNDVLDRITVTGHQLEWIALAPESLRPDRATIREAIVTLVRDVDSLTWPRTFKSQLPCTHAARALCLLKNENAFMFLHKSWQQGMQFTDRGYRRK